MSDVAERFAAAVAGTPLAACLPAALEPLLEKRGGDPALLALPDAVLRGVARAVASQPETGSFLAHRPALLARLAAADAGALEARRDELEAPAPSEPRGDLETALDALRLLRREETCLVGCLHQGGLVRFERVTSFLSQLAETIVSRALTLARRGLDDASLDFAVVGMGKIAGREFTYHSDLDLIFLYEGGYEAVDAASRVGQRLIAYVSTMTGAGIAYAVDTRLRPSGRQGMLVTALPAFERYQIEEAHTWEHVAILRARALAGDTRAAEEALGRVRARLLSRASDPWPELAAIRRRVEEERVAASPDAIAFKTGAGGLMDVDFLAGGGLLERPGRGLPPVPGVPEMLRAAVNGPRVEAILADYGFLRRVEAHARWQAGRPVELLPSGGEELDVLAELVEPGSSGPALREAVEATRARIREAWQAVLEARSVAVLES